MNTLTVRRGIAAVLFILLSPLSIASRIGLGLVPESAKIHIRLVDLAGLSPHIRMYAQRQVAHIFHMSGVELQFVDCLAADLPCRQNPGAGDVWLQVMAQAPRHPSADATGFAVLVPSRRRGESYAVVSWPMVVDAARNLEAQEGDVLAASMAHEIGHLLLGSTSHSRMGVMSPRIDRHQIALLGQGQLLFNADQAAKMAGHGSLWRGE